MDWMDVTLAAWQPDGSLGGPESHCKITVPTT